MTDDGGRHVALTALHGMGGIGKTVLAQALCCDEVVQQAFPDGVIWVTVGKESQFDALTRMREVARALKDDLSRYDNLLAATNQYRSTIRKKAALIVVDDVWRSSDLEPLLAENSPRSRMLFTTRDASIAVGAREHLAEQLSEQKSREVLARWAGTEADKLPSIAGDLIEECGYLPLALSMVGAMVGRKPPALWKRVLELLRSADLEKIKAQFPELSHYLIPRDSGQRGLAGADGARAVSGPGCPAGRRCRRLRRCNSASGAWTKARQWKRRNSSSACRWRSGARAREASRCTTCSSIMFGRNTRTRVHSS